MATFCNALWLTFTLPLTPEVERALHRAFAPNRINPKRAFFSIDTDQVIAILKLLHIDDAAQEIEAMASGILAEEVQAAKHDKARRPNLNFAEMGISLGAALHFVNSDATVTSNRKFVLNGAVMSLTAATRELLGLDYSVAPNPYWMFNSKSLRAIYDETYVDER